MKSNTKNFLFYFLIISALFLVLFTTLIFADSFPQYQRDAALRGFNHNSTGQWQHVGTTYTASAGLPEMSLPIVVDWDKDGKNELITFKSNFINV